MCFAYSKLLCSSTDTTQGPAHRAPAFPADFTRCLIVGPAASRLSTLALHFAANLALESCDSTAQIVVLGRKQAIEEHPPRMTWGIAEQNAALAQVKMRYLASYVELQQYLACAHLLSPTPKAIVLHNLSSFFPPEGDRRTREVQVARTLACLVNAAESTRWVYADSRYLLVTKTDRGCTLSIPILVTDEGSGTGSLQQDMWHLMSRWLPLILEVKGVSNGFSISVHPTCNVMGTLPEALQRNPIHYKIADTISVMY